MADQTESESRGADRRNVQRGRTSPSHTLEEAVTSVEKVFQALGTTKHSRDDAASAMGYKPGSGAANARVGSLTHFGLLERFGAEYQVSNLARRILEHTTPEERAEALVEASTHPSLYAELVEQLDGQPFPPMLGNILSRNYGVVPKSAPEVAQRFEESLRYAGLLRDGKVYATLTSSSGPTQADSPKRPSDAQTDPHSVVRPASPSPAGDAYQIPLRRNRVAVLNIPRPVDAQDLERIKAWIDLMEDVLTETDEASDEAKSNPEAID